MNVLRGRFVKVFSLVFAVLFVLSNGLAYAQIFTDVPDSHWASEYVEKMNKAGLITGYNDATFRPNGNVTRTQAIVMISRALELSTTEVTQARQTHQSFLNEIGVNSWASWAEDGIAVALAKGIVSKDVVRNTFYKSGKMLDAQRDELCIYLTRAMGLEDEVEDMTFWYLPFTDKETIPTMVQPYVKMMVDKGIINSAGDSKGNFNPTTPVNRAMMAKMLSVAYDYINDNEVSIPSSNTGNTGTNTGNTPPVVTNPNKNTTTVSGTIVSIMEMESINQVYVTIESNNGTKTTYKVDSNTVIKLDNKAVSQASIVEGLDVEAEVTADYALESINMESTEEEYSGEIKSLDISRSGSKITIEFEESRRTETKTFDIDDDVEVIIDDEDAELEDLEEGYIVDLYVTNNVVMEIDAEVVLSYLEGVINDIIIDDDETFLVIEDEDEKEYELLVDEDADIEREGRDALIRDLKVGDEVEVEIEDDMITLIESYMVEGNAEGIVYSINISGNPTITILNDDNEEETYTISKNVQIYIDGRKTDIYNLKLGYYVELDLESNQITYIEAEEREQLYKFNGVVKDVDRRGDELYIYNTDDRENLTISIGSDTKILDANGEPMNIRYIDEDDEVFVIGSYSGISFKAKTIILMKSL